MLVLTFVENTTSVRTSFLLSAIFKEMWAISPSEIIANKAIIHGLMNQHGFEESKQPFAIGLIGAIDNHLSIMPMAANGNSSTKIPTGSIAIVPLKGTMMKEDTYCSYGTLTIANIIRDLGSNADVAGIIIDADTGGGAVNAVPPLVDAVSFVLRSKPVVCLADTLASAGIWSMSFCSEIWASNTISSCFGSIGVMYSYQFYITEFLKENGIEQGNVYPDESNFKNLPFEELLKGNIEPLKTKVLSPLAQKFQSDIKKNIPSIDLSVEGIVNGEMFFAKDALKHGIIQGIGTMEDVVARVRKLAKTGTTGSSAQSTINKNNVSPKPNAQMKYATLCTLLSLVGLEFDKDGKASFTKEEIASIQGAYRMKFKAALDIKGVEYDAEGKTSLTEAEVQTIEDALNAEVPTIVKPAATTPQVTTTTASASEPVDFNAVFEKFEQRQAAFEQRMLSAVQGEATSTGRVITVGPGNPQGNSGGKNTSYVNGIIHDINLASEQRPWNQKALGLIPVSASTEINLDQVNQDLGAYSRQFISELRNLLIGDVLEPIFPTVSGFNDRLVTFSLWVEEVTQSYQKAWTPKGGVAIQPEEVVMRDIKIDTQFEDLKSIERTWLSDYNKEGSQAYKLSFVGYLLKLILTKARQEDNIAAIRGVYKAPVAGIAGKSINRQDGLYEVIRKAIGALKIKVFAVGEWNNDNILDWERQFIGSLPETIKDTPNLGLYVPTAYIEARWAKKRMLEGNYKDYDPSKTTIDGRENIRLIAVPYAGATKRVFLTFIGNIRQLEFINTDKDFVTLEKEKRVINAFADYKKAIHIGFTGKKVTNESELDYENQRIWVNDADEPETYYIPVDPDVTVPSVSIHTSIITSANTQATVITDIEHRKAGQKIRIKIGSTTNASKINTGGNFVLNGTNWTPTNVGDELVLIVRADLKMVEYQRLSAATSAAELESSATPSLGDFANGTSFATNDANTAAVTITDFNNATVGVEFTVYSSNPGTNKTSIANSGNFVLTAAWADGANAYLKLMKRPDGKFIETARG